MRSKILVGAALTLAMMTACTRAHESWETRTGTSMDSWVQQHPLPYMPADTKPGQFPLPGGFQLSGCLTGANDDFVLAEGNNAMVYRLLGTGGPGNVSEDLKLHDGETVALAGEDLGKRNGIGYFRVRQVQRLGVNCPMAVQGAINELNRPPSEKLGLKEAEQLPNPENQPGQPARGASVTAK
jgi:hypothetical protein